MENFPNETYISFFPNSKAVSEKATEREEKGGDVLWAPSVAAKDKAGVLSFRRAGRECCGAPTGEEMLPSNTRLSLVCGWLLPFQNV